MDAKETRARGLLKRYNEDYDACTWQVPGGRVRAIYHDAIERMARLEGIRFEAPAILRAERDRSRSAVTRTQGR